MIYIYRKGRETVREQELRGLEPVESPRESLFPNSRHPRKPGSRSGLLLASPGTVPPCESSESVLQRPHHNRHQSHFRVRGLSAPSEPSVSTVYEPALPRTEVHSATGNGNGNGKGNGVALARGGQQHEREFHVRRVGASNSHRERAVPEQAEQLLSCRNELAAPRSLAAATDPVYYKRSIRSTCCSCSRIAAVRERRRGY